MIGEIVNQSQSRLPDYAFSGNRKNTAVNPYYLVYPSGKEQKDLNMQGCCGMVAQTLKPAVFMESMALACAGYLYWGSSTHTPDILGNYISVAGIVVLLCGFIFGASWLSARDPVHSDMVVYSRSSGRAMRDHEQDTPVYIPGNLRLLIASTLICAVNIGLGVLLQLV